MSLPKRRRILLWSRDDISCCSCPDLKSVHTHCPCDSCCGRAVARATEYRHWVATRDYFTLIKLDDSTSERDSNEENDSASAFEVEQEVQVEVAANAHVHIVTSPEDVTSPENVVFPPAPSPTLVRDTELQQETDTCAALSPLIQGITSSSNEVDQDYGM